jgi:ribosomal protein S19
MTRSQKKGIYVSKLFKRKYLDKHATGRFILTHKRDSQITVDMIGMDIFVYNGQGYQVLHIIDDMVGYKLGSFVFTTKMGNSIHNTKKNKKKYKNKK